MNYPITLACLGFFGAKTIDLDETRKAGGYRGARPFDAADFAGHIDRVLGWYDPQITLAQLNLLDSHDTPRFITSVSGDQTALRLSYLFLFSYPGAPCIYYGDEIGLHGKHDPYCRNSFPWDESAWDHDLRGFVQRCIALRKSYPALRRGSYHRLYAHDEVMAFARWLGDEKLIIVLNASTATKNIALSLDAIKVSDAVASDVWNGGTLHPIESGQLRDLKIAPRSGCVLKVLPVEKH
jgi:neopullulanase